MIFTLMDERYLRVAVAGIPKVTWNVVKDLYVEEFDNKGFADEEGSAMCENLKRLAAVVLQVPSAEKSYLAMREECFWRIRQGSLQLFLTLL